MGRRNDHTKEEIKEMALASAKKMICARGLSGLSTRKIAKEIGYTVGSLYLVFKNLDDLILQVNVETLDEMLKLLKATVAQHKSPESCVRALGQTYIGFARKNLNRWNILFEHRLPEGEELPSWYQEKLHQIFGLIALELDKIPQIHASRQAALVASVLWSGVHGICILGLNDKLDVSGVDAMDEMVDSLIIHYLKGYSAPAISTSLS